MVRSRIALAIIGMLLIGGISAAGAVLTTPGAWPATHTSASAQRGATGANAPTQPPAPPAGTATPTEVDLATPVATRTPSGQVSVHGGVIGNTINVTAQTFAITQRTGNPLTIVVDGSTQFQGVAQSFSGLRGGLLAGITGKFLTNGEFLAAVIDTSPPDN